MHRGNRSLWAIATACLLAGSSAHAATATGSFNVRITIQAECKVQSANDLNFGTRGVIDANIDQTTTLAVQCTNVSPYNVGLIDVGVVGLSFAV
jgi:spore coat protein U-like protein